jgi:hypothetical protein
MSRSCSRPPRRAKSRRKSGRRTSPTTEEVDVVFQVRLRSGIKLLRSMGQEEAAESMDKMMEKKRKRIKC